MQVLLFSSELFVFFSSRIRHSGYWRDWSSDVCSSDLLLSLLDAGARMLHVLALRAPLGTLFLWAIERTLYLAQGARLSWLRHRGYAPESRLPRARLLDRKSVV